MWLQGVGQDWETFTFTFHNTRYHQTFPNALPCAQDMQLNMKGSEDWWCISKCLIRELRPMRKTRPVLKATEKQWHRRSSKMVWVERRREKWYECTRWSDHWGLQRSKYLKEEVLSYILNVYGRLLLMLLPRVRSTCITWELVGGAGSWAPPKLYWIRICILIRSLGYTDAQWNVIITGMDMSDGGSVGEQLNEKLHNVFGFFLRKEREELTVKEGALHIGTLPHLCTALPMLFMRLL